MKHLKWLTTLSSTFFFAWASQGLAADSSFRWWTDASFLKSMNVGVRSFSGGFRGGYFRPNELLSTQVTQGMTGSPEPAKSIAGGFTLFAGSNINWGREHAAVIEDKNGNVVFVALIHYSCITPNQIHDPVVARAIQSRAEQRSQLQKQGLSEKALPRQLSAVSCQRFPTATLFTRSTVPTSVLESFKEWAKDKISDEQLTITVKALP